MTNFVPAMVFRSEMITNQNTSVKIISHPKPTKDWQK